MGHRDSQFDRCQGYGNRGINVPNHKDEIGLLFEEDGLYAFKDFRSLLCVSTGTDSKINVRFGNAHLTKEDVRKVFIVMLTSVDEDGFDFWMTLHLANEGGDFGEIWTCAYNINDFA